MVAVDGAAGGNESGQSFGEWQLGVVEPQTQRARGGVVGNRQAFEWAGDDGLVPETCTLCAEAERREHDTASWLVDRSAGSPTEAEGTNSNGHDAGSGETRRLQELQTSSCTLKLNAFGLDQYQLLGTF